MKRIEFFFRLICVTLLYFTLFIKTLGSVTPNSERNRARLRQCVYYRKHSELLLIPLHYLKTIRHRHLQFGCLMKVPRVSTDYPKLHR